jgi:hypothetical protein
MAGHKFRALWMVPCLCLTGAALRADVLVTTSIGLTSLTFTPSSGSIEFLSPLNSPPGCTMASLCATAFAEAKDGGSDQQFNVADNGTASATAATALANANATASAPSQTASAASGVNIVGIAASASSGAQGTLYGTFQIINTTGSVDVDFSASLVTDQHLKTDNFGVSAYSEVIFSTVLSNGDIPLFFDLPHTIGPNTELFDSRAPHLTNTKTLIANTPYSLVVQVDAESRGINSAIPEPSALYLLLTVAAVSGLIMTRK